MGMIGTFYPRIMWEVLVKYIEQMKNVVGCIAGDRYGY